ncbi:hypothetical protein Esti_006465 [Eimeria stiedai]
MLLSELVSLPALAGLLFLLQGAATKHSTKGKHVEVVEKRQCPEPYVFNEERALCVMTHAMPPLKICPNGVLRDDMCFIVSLPDATPCPGGFMEQLVDGDKLCVATRVARMRLACWGPFERLEGDVCVERIVEPLTIECPRGSLNFQQKCEDVLIEVPKPVCDPGYFELDGLCVRRRVIPCVETKESLPVLPSKGEELFSRKWPKDAHSKPLLEFPDKAAFPVPLGLDQAVNEIYILPSVGDKFESSFEPHSDAPVFFGSRFPSAELVEEASFGKTSKDASFSPVHQVTLDKDRGNASGSTSFSHAQQIETDLQGFVKRRNADSRSSFLGVDANSSSPASSLALRRRLHATEQNPTDGNAGRRGAGKEVGAENSGSQRREEVQAHPKINDGRGAESLEDSPRQSFLGVPFLPGQSGMFLAGSLLPMSRGPFVSPVNPMLMPLQPAYRPLLHDNRFGYSLGTRLLPRTLKPRYDLEQGSAYAPLTSVALQPSKPHENETATSSPTTKEPTKQLFSFLTKSNILLKDSNSSSEEPSDVPNQQGRHTLPVFLRVYRRLTKVEGAALKDRRESNRWSGRQQDVGVQQRLSAQRQKGVHDHALKEQGSHLSRRLDGTDYIPGCWEEDVHVPTEWACDAKFDFDREQHICFRMEIFNPNIICDGHVENGLCVREIRKPSQLYCPLDPPPKDKEEKKKKGKEEKKKEEKKDLKKDEKKPDANKKPNSPSKPTNGEQKKTGPGQGETKGQKKSKGSVKTTLGGRTEGSPGEVKTLKPGGSEAGGSSTIKRAGGGYMKSQGTATSVQEAEGNREGTAGSASQDMEANSDAPGSPFSGRQQSRTSRLQSEGRSERQETTVETQRPENAAEEEEAQPGSRNEPSRQRPGSRRRPADRSESVKPQAANTNSDDEGEDRDGSRATQTQQGRPQQALRRVSLRPQAQGRREETRDSPSLVREDDEERGDEDADNAEGRSGDLTGRQQVPQRSNVQLRGRPRPPQTQPSRSRQDTTRDTQANDDDEGERSGDLTSHLFGRRLQPEPQGGKKVQSRHQTYTDNDSHSLLQEAPRRAADDAVGLPGNHEQHDDEDAFDENSEAVKSESQPPDGEQAPETFVKHAPKSDHPTAAEASPSLEVTAFHIRRRLDQTRLPYAYFIMGVNQWRYIHDPVHLLRMETASDRAQEQAALRHNPPLEQVGYLDPRMGVFGPPTRAGPQVYSHDLKDKKKPTTSPLKIREGTLCYRQERKRPLVECPPGFTANKEGGCYMLIAPEFTCLAHRELEPGAPASNKKTGGKGKKH